VETLRTVLAQGRAQRPGRLGRRTGEGEAWRAPIGLIHWAGAECAPQWNGYMEGAVRSGEATADTVAAL